jgi:hypothetical protein
MNSVLVERGYLDTAYALLKQTTWPPDCILSRKAQRRSGTLGWLDI